MKALETKNIIKKEKLVPILRTRQSDVVMEIAKVSMEAGSRILEFTMTIDGIIDKIGPIKEKYPDLILGLGTVYEKKEAEEAIRRGVDFLVSPILNYDIIEIAKKYDTMVMLSGFTPTEIYEAYRAGSDIVKLFPASEVAPTFIRELQGPLPFVEIFPTGGLNLISAIQFLSYGAVAVGMGNTVFKKELLESGNFEEIKRRLINAKKRIQNMSI